MASATNTHSQHVILERICFHSVCGDYIRISDKNMRATRDRLGHTLLFSNRPILSDEIVQFIIEDTHDGYHGVMRIGFTTINPVTFKNGTIPKSMPQNDNRDWLVPSLSNVYDLKRGTVVRSKFTNDGDIYVQLNDAGLVKMLTVTPVTGDLWFVIDLVGSIPQVLLTQNGFRVSDDSVERAMTRFEHYTSRGLNRTSSVFYGDELIECPVRANGCDSQSYTRKSIAVKRNADNSTFTIEKVLKRAMLIVLQIIDMDHTLTNYFTVRCSVNDGIDSNLSKKIDSQFDYLTIGDEIGIRVQADGVVTFSSNNRRVKSLFTVDLSVNDNRAARETKFYLDFLLNGRVTGLRLIGIHESKEFIPAPVIGGGCLSTTVVPVCPNPVSGMLMPCRHLVVCYDCGKTMIKNDQCPKIKCRKPVEDCLRVYRG